MKFNEQATTRVKADVITYQAGTYLNSIALKTMELKMENQRTTLQKRTLGTG